MTATFAQDVGAQPIGPHALAPARALPRFDRLNTSAWRVLAVVVLALFHNDFLAVATGMDEVLVRQMGMAVVSVSSAACFLMLAMRGELFRHPFLLWPFVLFLTLVVTSLFANTVFYPKPVGDWLWAHYIYMPVFQFYIFAALRFTDRELVWGLIGAGVIAAVLMLGYELHLFHFLDSYVRRSIFGRDVTRIVIMKEEFFFASLGLFAVLLAGRIPVPVKLAAAPLLVLCLYLQARVVQSRQGLIAMGIGMLVLLLIDRRTFRMRPFLVRAAIGVFGLMLAPLALAQYIELLFRNDLLESRELNVAIRFQTFDQYLIYFKETLGFGFGMSAPSGRVNNIIATTRALHVNFVDLGLYGALFQFGIIGGLLALALTVLAVVWGYRAARAAGPGEAWRPALLCAFFIGWLCVPVPLNVFTFANCIDFGACILYLTWYCSNSVRYRAAMTHGAMTRGAVAHGAVAHGR